MIKDHWLNLTRPFFIGVFRSVSKSLEGNEWFQYHIYLADSVTDLCQDAFSPRPSGLESRDIVQFYLEHGSTVSPI